MARSVKWPFERTARGGLALTPATDGGRTCTQQVIMIGLLPGPASNPALAVQGVGGPDMAFGVASAPNIDALAAHAERLFQRLERQGRARLEPGFPRVETQDDVDPATGLQKVVVAIEYVDLEANPPRRDRVEVPL